MGEVIEPVGLLSSPPHLRNTTFSGIVRKYPKIKYFIWIIIVIIVMIYGIYIYPVEVESQKIWNPPPNAELSE